MALTTSDGSVVSRLARRRRGLGGRASGVRIRESRTDRVFLFCVYAFLTFVIVVIAVPLLYVLANSFSSPNAIQSGKVFLWPVHFTLLGYRIVFNYPAVWQGYLNSIIYTAGGALLTVALTVLMAYPLSRKGFYGRKLFIWAVLLALLFNGGL